MGEKVYLETVLQLKRFCLSSLVGSQKSLGYLNLKLIAVVQCGIDQGEFSVEIIQFCQNRFTHFSFLMQYNSIVPFIRLLTYSLLNRQF